MWYTPSTVGPLPLAEVTRRATPQYPVRLATKAVFVAVWVPDGH